MYSNDILNFQKCTTILNTCTKKSGNLLNAPRIYLSIYIYIHTHTHTHEGGLKCSDNEVISAIDNLFDQWDLNTAILMEEMCELEGGLFLKK